MKIDENVVAWGAGLSLVALVGWRLYESRPKPPPHPTSVGVQPNSSWVRDYTAFRGPALELRGLEDTGRLGIYDARNGATPVVAAVPGKR